MSEQARNSLNNMLNQLDVLQYQIVDSLTQSEEYDRIRPVWTKEGIDFFKNTENQFQTFRRAVPFVTNIYWLDNYDRLYTTDSNVSREHFYGNSRISLLEESGGDDCYVPPSVPEYQLVPDSDEVFSYLKNVYRLRQGKERRGVLQIDMRASYMEEILNSTEEKMMLTIESLENKFTNVRAGRANPNMLDGIMVEYYGVPTPLKSLANISIPEARQLSIKPFDRSCLGAIEKAIFEANLGVTPNNNGEVVFIVIPPLTEDRRKELVKQVKGLGEEAKIALRNIRQDANKALENLELPEDEEKRGNERVQDKEKDLMTI